MMPWISGRPSGLEGHKLAFVSTFPCDPVGGDVENRDCVRVSDCQRRPLSPTVIQDFLISQNAHDLYMGGVGTR